ncbi:MAG: hypothetical protein JW825_04085, partial [Candidatus Methanofastidiosa archaeon]|nr:hypothetical protein [Candidatus Methanofastidiosa archaeon]
MDHPKVLVVVDSGDFRGEFGELRFFSADDLKVLSDGFSIHTWPLPNELARYKGDVHILLCQIMEPDNDSFRLGLSPKISDSVRKACDMLYDLIGVNT